MNKTAGSAIIMTMGSVLVAGCGVSSTTKIPSSQATGTHSSTSPTTTTTPSNTSSPSSSSTPSQSTSTSSTGSTGSSSTSSSSTTAASSSSASGSSDSSLAGMNLVKAWMQSGLKGEGPNMPIGDGKTIEAVQQEWGKGTSASAGAGLYFTYGAHNAAFGVGAGDQIFDVRSSSSSIQHLTRTDVTAALGSPAAIRYADNTTIYMYLDGPNYQVLWTFPGGPGKTSNTVQHVSVFWPQGTVNLMGQTLPNPSVVVTKSSASQNSYLPFSIKNAPSGYRLDALEWLPSGTGTTVVESDAEAIYNGAHGIGGAVFMKAYGSYRFQFPSSMKNTSGKIRLIYESSRGNAIIGTSNPITLP